MYNVHSIIDVGSRTERKGVDMDNENIIERLGEVKTAIYNAGQCCRGIGQLVSDVKEDSGKVQERELSAIDGIAYMLESVLYDAGDELDRIETEIKRG